MMGVCLFVFKQWQGYKQDNSEILSGQKLTLTVANLRDVTQFNTILIAKRILASKVYTTQLLILIFNFLVTNNQLGHRITGLAS